MSKLRPAVNASVFCSPSQGVNMSIEILSPKLDIVFKKLFSEHLDLLQHFVAAMMSIPPESITRLELSNTEMPPEDIVSKFSRLDLKLWMNETQIDIEIQVRKIIGFRERALFYWAKLFTSSLKSGDEYEALAKAVSINLLDFNLFEHRESPHTEIVPVIKGTDEIFSDKMILHFFELRKVVKLNQSESSELCNTMHSGKRQNTLSPAMKAWLDFLNSKTEEDLKMFEDDKIIHKATLILRELSGDEKLKEQARQREKRLHDEASELATARLEGRHEGLKEGLKEGKLTTLFSLVEDGDISVEKAAKKSNMTQDEFIRAMSQYKAENVENRQHGRLTSKPLTEPF